MATTKPMTLVLGVIATVAVTWLASTALLRSSSQTSSSTTTKKGASIPKIPFVYIETPATRKITPTKSLYYSIQKFRGEISQALQGLSQMLEQALALEQSIDLPTNVRLSTKIKNRIQQLSDCLEQDERTLQDDLLVSSDFLVTALAHQPWKGTMETTPTYGSTQDAPQSSHFQMLHTKAIRSSAPLEENAYDSAAQVMAHLVRDWTSEGANVRKHLYDWCLQQLQQHSHRLGPPPSRVLVPGAGMGRLAHDIYQAGFTVEANELSPVMATAAHAILQRQVTGTVHPFALDMLSNEVQADRRYDTADFPDTTIQASTVSHSSLSFTIGDFVGPYYESPSLRATFGSVVTCFFIDTATNIYDYLELLAHLIQPGGVWINVGPVQWHGNAVLHPSVDELRELVSSFGFRIIHWQVDIEPVPYRQDDSATTTNRKGPFVRTTNYDAYRPLRFVAIRTGS